MEPGSVQVEDFRADGLPSTVVYTDEEDRVYSASRGQQQQQRSGTLAVDDDSILSVIQSKVFRRRRRAAAVLDGDPQRGLPPKCCDRCKSDLNGRLMVRCATCSFRCHLYCFSPPLKQHPAFLIRRQQQTSHNDPEESPPIWKCAKCEGTSVVFNVNPRPPSSATRSPQKLKPDFSPTKHKSDSRTRANAQPTSLTGDKDNADPGWIHPVQPQWIEKSGVVFDWYRFRSEKSEALRSGTSHKRNGVDELVYYSKSYALMKKAAAIWRAHALKRRRFRHQQELEIKAMQYPAVKYNVMHVRKLTANNAVNMPSQDDLDEAEEEAGNLVDTSHYKPYSRRPRLPLLWEGEPPSALMCCTTGERVEIADILSETEERLCLASEDANAPAVNEEKHRKVGEVRQSDDPKESTDNKPKTVQIDEAAAIIQRIMTRHYRWRRRIERVSRQRRALEETERIAKARSSVSLLRTCIQFIVLLMKMLGRARTKKAMVLVLRDAAEESRVTNNMLTNEGANTAAAKKLEREHTQQLAEVRIRRFFVRRVHPYVKLKNNVMARRLQHWWKRELNLYKWREAGLATRVSNWNQASTRIQRFYRHFRTRRQFRTLIEKSALKKLRRVLAGWLFSRLVKKETKRCAAYEAAQLSEIGTEGSPLPLDAPIHEILEKRGLDLYEQADFWNATLILERLCEMRKGNLTRDLQQVLAYSHHMTWYSSYDQFNLLRAHELYCSALESSPNGERPKRVNPSVLHDFAIVMMQMEHFGDSLRLLAKLIEYFARQPQFPLWLLLAAVQLQQRGEWEQSVGYLTYLHDIPPPPYLERDILALCAMGYEQLTLAAAKETEARTSNAALAKEAWRAALRQRSLEKITNDRPDSASADHSRGNGRALPSRQKWELLTSLGQRALDQGHYLLTCRVLIYTLEHEGPALDNDQDKRTAWWNLADAFRHLGHLELYLNAAQRSQSAVDEELQKDWQELAEQQACSFQTELKTLTVLGKQRQLSGNTN